MRKFLLTVIFILLANLSQAETISLSTYFTAPFGVYQQMRLFPLGSEAGVCNINNNGLMYILNNGTPGESRYCWGGAGNAVTTTWRKVANNMYPADVTNVNLRVGIGTGVAAVAQKLQVLSNGPTIARFEGAANPPRIEFAQAGAVQGYIGASAAHAFVVQNNVGAPQVVITQTGNVGIGTTAPSQMLHVNSLGTWAGTRVTTAATGSTIGDGVHFGYDEAYGGYIWNREATAIVFSTNNTEKVRIASDGNVGIGVSPAAGYKLDVQQAGIGVGFDVFRFMNGTNETLIFDYLGNLVLTGGAVFTDGFFYSPSDISLKKNIKKAPGLAAIMKLDGIRFDWKNSGKADIGVSAQNIEKVFPALVKENSQTHKKSVKYEGLIGPLIEAVKEQQQELDGLRKKIEYLKSRQ